MAVVHPRISRADFEALYGEGKDPPKLELLDGEVVVIPPPGGWHGYAHPQVVVAISDWQRATGDGGILLTDIRVPMGEDNLVPDLAYWSAERRPVLGRGQVERVPDLVVEIASPSTQANDLGPKRRSYVQAGVREQWLIDPAARAALIVDGADRERELAEGHELTSAVLPGLAVPLRTLFV